MAVLLFLTGILAFYSQVVHSVLIPGPDNGHKYKSAVAEFALTDTARKDPHAEGEDREIMVSLFMPIPVTSCTGECQHTYMPSTVAKIANNQTLGNYNNSVFEKMAYAVCCSSYRPIDASKIPVVVLEPHTDTSRLLYSNLARYMTANNVAVVLLDHPYDSSIVEFHDGRIVYQAGATGLSNFSPLTAWNATVTSAIDIRIADIEFALSALTDPSILATNFPKIQFTGALDTSKYSIVGHGLGGTVATSLSSSSDRVFLSINLSGSPPPLNHTISTPTFLLGRSDFRRTDDILWPSSWPFLTGPATEFDLADSGIMDFTDLPIVIEVSGVKGLKGKGLGNSGPWANHAVKCFVEGILRDNVHGETGAVHDCVRIFEERMFPYMVGRRMDVVKRSGAVSRRGVLRAGMRHWLETWGFM
jgi:hypothetical protein